MYGQAAPSEDAARCFPELLGWVYEQARPRSRQDWQRGCCLPHFILKTVQLSQFCLIFAGHRQGGDVEDLARFMFTEELCIADNSAKEMIGKNSKQNYEADFESEVEQAGF